MESGIWNETRPETEPETLPGIGGETRPGRHNEKELRRPPSTRTPPSSSRARARGRQPGPPEERQQRRCSPKKRLARRGPSTRRVVRLPSNSMADHIILIGSSAQPFFNASYLPPWLEWPATCRFWSRRCLVTDSVRSHAARLVALRSGSPRPAVPVVPWSWKLVPVAGIGPGEGQLHEAGRVEAPRDAFSVPCEVDGG